jgi:hypothetical protein
MMGRYSLKDGANLSMFGVSKKKKKEKKEKKKEKKKRERRRRYSSSQKATEGIKRKNEKGKRKGGIWAGSNDLKLLGRPFSFSHPPCKGWATIRS